MALTLNTLSTSDKIMFRATKYKVLTTKQLVVEYLPGAAEEDLRALKNAIKSEDPKKRRNAIEDFINAMQVGYQMASCTMGEVILYIIMQAKGKQADKIQELVTVYAYTPHEDVEELLKATMDDTWPAMMPMLEGIEVTRDEPGMERLDVERSGGEGADDELGLTEGPTSAG